MDQEIRFCTSADGVRLAYAISGNGPPLVKAANWLSHLEFDWASPLWRHWNQAFSSDSTFIRYDARGCGLSDWDVDEFSFEPWLEDLITVVETIGLDEFDLLGISRGAPLAAAYAARFPDRVRRMVLYGGFAQGWKTRPGSPESRQEREAALTLTRLGWGNDNPAYRQIFTSQFVPEGSEEQVRWFNDMQLKSTSPENAYKLIESSGSIDVSELLSKIKAPTLVAHARNDARCPFDGGRALAAGIANSRFLPLDSRNHILLEHEPAFRVFISEAKSFLEREMSETRDVEIAAQTEQTPVRELATILFTDIVGSTERALELGDRAWTILLHRHYAVIRTSLAKHGGTEVDTAGDGFLATFESPLRAIRCADDVIRASAAIGVPVRAGIHAGEIERVGDKLSGIAVHVAARIMDQAGPSELLVSGTVKDLTAGAGISFGEPEERKLKGLPGSWRLFSVRPD